MRIIAGKLKGRLLRIPKGLQVRPTKDVVKEALFNVLGQRIRGACFLELFAGSGSVGIEALSREAGSVIFVENNRLCVRSIEDNLRRLGISYASGLKSRDAQAGVQVGLLSIDAQQAIKILWQNGKKFDLIFLDPPYHRDELKNCLIKLYQYDILKPRSLVIAEHNQSQGLPEALGGLRRVLSKRYGKTLLSFYQKGRTKI